MEFTEYEPTLFLKNGHINTIYASLCRPAHVLSFKREKLYTPDDDFLDLDTLFKNNRRLAILCHGLEGTSGSKYILATSSILSKNNWDIVAVNYRGCSGNINNQVRMYHSGATDDLELVVNLFKDAYREIHLVGFSLGGNLVLKYCGEADRSQTIRSVVAISTPTNLKAGSLQLNKPSNLLYTKKFLATLKEKIRLKHAQYPEIYKVEKLNEIKTVYEFDDYYTAPIHGFKNADDYYQKCSSAQFIESIKNPGLIINALDDPFLPNAFYPFEEVRNNKLMSILSPKNGGHVGFVKFGKKYYWSEEQIKMFLEKNSEMPM